jgi:hypothetical protein
MVPADELVAGDVLHCTSGKTSYLSDWIVVDEVGLLRGMVRVDSHHLNHHHLMPKNLPCLIAAREE